MFLGSIWLILLVVFFLSVVIVIVIDLVKIDFIVGYIINILIFFVDNSLWVV